MYTYLPLAYHISETLKLYTNQDFMSTIMFDLYICHLSHGYDVLLFDRPLVDFLISSSCMY